MNHLEMYSNINGYVWIMEKFDPEHADIWLPEISKILIKKCGVKALSDAETRELIKYKAKKPAMFHYLLKKYGHERAYHFISPSFYEKNKDREPKQGLNYHNPIYAKLLLRK